MSTWGIENADINRMLAARYERLTQPPFLVSPDREELYEGCSTVMLHVSPNFWTEIPYDAYEQLLKRNGFSQGFDRTLLPDELREQLLMRVPLDNAGMFTFMPTPGLVLAQTEEEIAIPATETWFMADHLVDTRTGEVLPLTAHWGASILHANSVGSQTYEIVNLSRHPITIDPKNLACITFIKTHSAVTVKHAGTFSQQTKGEMRLGNPYSEAERKMLLKTIGS